MRLEDLIDRQAIQDLLVLYAKSLDAHDWSALSAVFLPDATGIYDGDRYDGLDAIVDLCRRSLEPLTASQHFLGNFSAEIEGDRAQSSCYLHAQHYRSGGRGLSTYVMAGTYRDRLVRTHEGWRIEHRELAITWTDGNSGVFSERRV
jgi:3-phenylpropionate/cinnamic acid dioxygenase small subunit